MATAVEPGSEPRTPSAPLGLPAASVFGAAYVVAALAVFFYVVPSFWGEFVSPLFGPKNALLDGALYYLVRIAALAGLVWFGRAVLAPAAPKGVHGGIFLVISAAVAIFFVWRAVALNVEGGAGLIAGAVVAALLGFFALRFLTGPTGRRWMVGLEEQGWFSTAGYKPSLGKKLRRLTTLGILILGGTGVYSLWVSGTLPDQWALALPFEAPSSVTVLRDAKVAIPGLLLALTGWVAWRAVHVPAFAEFLIATEAEMNKVSWTPKKRLAQDTVVVLTTTLIMVLFLLVVDLFWGWLLSREVVGVLPGKGTGRGDQDKAQQARW